MPKIHFVKDGLTDKGQSIADSCYLPITTLDALVPFESAYYELPPTINRQVVADVWAAYKHVVLEIEADDPHEHFFEPGYYYFPTLKPVECERLLHIEMGEY